MEKYEYILPRDYIGDILIQEAEKDNRIVVIDSDLSSSVTTHKFQKRFPERFFEMGIAEQNSLGVTAGLATEDFIPFYVNFAIFGTGTVWTQLRQCCYANLNIKIIGTHPGMDNGPDGASHHALEDIALTRVLPNLKIFNPTDLEDLKSAVKRAIRIKGPVYIRTARDTVPVIHEKEVEFKEGKAEIIFNEGKDYLLIFEGTAAKHAIEGFELLKERGYGNKLLNIRSIKPMDMETVLKEARGMKGIITIENHTVNGGLGGAVAEIIAESSIGIPLRRIGVQDKFTESGGSEAVKEKYGLSGERIAETIETF